MSSHSYANVHTGVVFKHECKKSKSLCAVLLQKQDSQQSTHDDGQQWWKSRPALWPKQWWEMRSRWQRWEVKWTQPCRGHLMLLLSEALQDWVDVFKGFVDFCPHFCSCQYHFSGDKDEQHYTRFHHAVYQTREQFWLIAGELTVC